MVADGMFSQRIMSLRAPGIPYTLSQWASLREEKGGGNWSVDGLAFHYRDLLFHGNEVLPDLPSSESIHVWLTRKPKVSIGCIPLCGCSLGTLRIQHVGQLSKKFAVPQLTYFLAHIELEKCKNKFILLQDFLLCSLLCCDLWRSSILPCDP